MCLVLLSFVGLVNAQDEGFDRGKKRQNKERQSNTNEDIDDERLIDKLFFGGSFGLQFGDVTSVDVSPLVGYRITDRWSAGVGVIYQFTRFRQLDFSTNIYGGRVFTRYTIFQNVFAQFEYEAINLEVFDLVDFSTEREWVGSAFIGGGYVQRFGNRGGITFTALFDLNFDENRSPRSSPLVLRVGFFI